MYENASESSFVNSSFFASPVKSMTTKKLEESKMAKQPSKPKIVSQLSRIIESPADNDK